MSTAIARAITIDELTPQWLTEVLRREGVLLAGSVVAIDKQPNSAFNSHTLHLTPIYSETQPGNAPARLLLKCSLPQAWAKRAGAREVGFYQMVQTLPDHPPVIVRCYDAVYDIAPDGEIGDSHILLDDLSESHVIPGPRDKQITLVDNLPTDDHLTQAVDALARFHAYWWQHPLLGIGAARLGAWCSDAEHFADETTRRRHAWVDLIANETEALPSQVTAIYERILVQLPYLWQTYFQPRLATFKDLTLTHGDSYLANFLCPRPGQQGNSYIIDWQGPEVYLGASDLVTMCATFWTREQRAESERELNVLRHYYRTLLENGVRGYAWEDLVRDYQYAIVDWLLVAVQDRLDGAGKSYWWPKMQCLIAAYEDWRVSDLFADN
jgi:hypothetical protein